MKGKLLAVVSLSVALVVLAQTAAGAVVPVERVFGTDRVGTAVEVSRAFFEPDPDFDNFAVVARADAFPDALAAVTLTDFFGAPVLLTPPGELAGAVRDELSRLEVDRILVVGGTSAISAGVERELGAIAPVTRLAGPDRYTTARAIADFAFAAFLEDSEGSFVDFVVASGRSFPDALSAATVIAAAPSLAIVLLTDGTTVPDTLDDTTDVTVVGGPAAVPEQVVAGLRAQGNPVERLAGVDRYGTSGAVLEDAIGAFDPEAPLIMASGADFPDALAAGALAVRGGAPLVITAPDAVPASLRPSLEAVSGEFPEVLVIGGPAAVTDRVAADIAAAVT